MVDEPPARRMVPVPEAPDMAPLPSAASLGAAATLLPNDRSTSGGGSLATRDAVADAVAVPETLQRSVAMQSSATKALQAELSLAQTQAKQAALDLREAKAALV